MTRQPYPRDGSDEAWAFVTPSLTFMTDDAPQRDHALRPPCPPRRGGRGGDCIVRASAGSAHRTGAPWRMLPTDLPPCSTVSQHTQRWLKAGVGATLVHDRRALVRDIEGRAPAPRAAIGDARTMQSPPRQPPLSPPACGGERGGAARAPAMTGINAARAARSMWRLIRWASCWPRCAVR